MTVGPEIDALGRELREAVDQVHQLVDGGGPEAGAPEGKMPPRPEIPARSIQHHGVSQSQLIIQAVQKSIDLLQLSSDTFLDIRRNCVSCHHQNLPGVAIAWARDRGFHVRQSSINRMVQRQAKSWEPRVDRAYQLDAPLAPDVAARWEDTRVDPQSIVAGYREIARGHDITLVEGAGGLLVPIVDRYTMADLAGDLGIPLVVVVDSKLGAINHTLLTLEAADSRGIEVCGYVLNHTSDEPDMASETNAALLDRSTDVACLGTIEWSPAAVNDPTAVISTAVDWTRLQGAFPPRSVSMK